jgi:hypothetical protein
MEKKEMAKFTLEQLSQGIRDKHVGAERKRLVEKWAQTGLLRGLADYRRESMAQLLENQTAQLIKESNGISTGGGGMTSSGQLSGYSNVALPIVRKVFGGLVANDLVSLQPMSLPSGLIFYLDYTYGNAVGGTGSTNDTYTRGQSIYGNPTAKGIASGSLAAGGMYDLAATGFTKVHGNTTALSGSNALIGAWSGAADAWVAGTTVASETDFSGSNARFLDFDQQVQNDLDLGVLDVAFAHFTVAELVTQFPKADLTALSQFAVFEFDTQNNVTAWGEKYQGGRGVLNLRRLNKRGDFSGGVFTPNPQGGTHVQVVLRLTNGGSVPATPASGAGTVKASMALADQLTVDTGTGSTLTVPGFESDFGTTPTPAIPEIDIKIEQVSITANTRKLRARWSPEMAQDLNAYHAMDAEVELTAILSEQIALEIDREILNDLVTMANGANFFWSRSPGRFVNKATGERQNLANEYQIGPSFTGTVREWYETLIETIIDVANTIHRKTLRGSANFIVTSPDVCTLLEASVLYKPKLSIDGNGQVGSPFTIGAEPVGTLSNRFTVYKDPYFVPNKVLVGFKGGSYLETGYVYAPYVPLIVTPTIFAAEDFTPRKGVMTRYGKKMLRSDFYGTVTIMDMQII